MIIEGAKSRGVAKFTFDFAVQGGTVGDIVLNGDPLPSKAIVWDGVVDILTPLTDGSDGTSALSTAQSANDLISDTANSGAPWSSTGLKAIVPVGTQATAIKLTAERKPKLVVAGHDLTAGKFNLFLQYFLSD